MKIRLLSDCEGNEWGCICVDRLFVELDDGTVLRLTEESLHRVADKLEIISGLAVEENQDRNLLIPA